MVTDLDTSPDHQRHAGTATLDSANCFICKQLEVALVLRALRGYRYTYADEIALQAGLAEALAAESLNAEREVRLTPRDRIDLLVGRVGIEVKVAGTADGVLRQLSRYACSDRIGALVLVTTRATHLGMPMFVGGKTLDVVYQGGAA
jgi:hypothetical protein